MCGIVGVKSEAGAEIVEKMLNCIQFRGPDARGVKKSGRWTLGHVRLSILDVEGGHQPMACDEAHIVHNGEIYNYRQLRQGLGGDFQTDSDTEVILRLHGTGRNPEDWLQELDGMYAFAIVDKDGLLLARDPMGIKPLYIGVRDGQVAFASEIKSLLNVTDQIIEFPPGHYYTSRKGGKPFHKAGESKQQSSSADELASQILTRLTHAVESRLISDVPVGVFLSGGLDSSIIAAIANMFSPEIQTFAVGIEGSPDLEAARKVARHIGTDHHERVFTLREAVAMLKKVIYHLESFDAALVRSAVANYFLAELASAHVKVALSGEGADELFAGYEYLGAVHGSRLERELAEITDALHNTNLQRCDRMSMAHGLEVRVPYLDDLGFVELAKSIPVQFKLEPKQGIEKWILRKAVEGILPHEVVWRKKAKFAEGAGIAEQLEAWCESKITDEMFERGQRRYADYQIRSKEELVYFLIFKELFPPSRMVSLIGRSRSI